MHEEVLSKLVLWDNPEGWDGEGGFRMVWHRYICGWFMLMYGRNHHNIVKYCKEINFKKIEDIVQDIYLKLQVIVRGRKGK